MQFSKKIHAQKRPKVLSSQHVTIVMATFNGGQMIDAQLESIARQSHTDWSLIVSDDGSTDDTFARVQEFARNMPDHRIARIKGPGKGSALNFLSLLRAAGATPWLAFADQDDVWLEDRLERGLVALSTLEGPAIYGSRTVIVDESLRQLGFSPAFGRSPGFSNALVQNIAGGNTMLLNRAALDVLQPASLGVGELVSHDWWAYQVITGIGGRMFFDLEPTVLYRQHTNNQVGANDTLAARFVRFRALISGTFANWCRIQTEALTHVAHLLTPEARRCLSAMEDLRGLSPISRIRALRRSGVYRQSLNGTIALWVAVFLGRV